MTTLFPSNPNPILVYWYHKLKHLCNLHHLPVFSPLLSIMADAPSVPPSHLPFSLYPPPPVPPPNKLNLSPFYYGLAVIGSTAVVLALYNLIVIGVCGYNRRQRLHQRPNLPFSYPRQSTELSTVQLYSTFKYSTKESQEQISENECSVCLSAFEDGEDIRQLPRCKHSFHAPCIDMWLYSHSDCPLCRAAVGPPVSHNLVLSEDNSREYLRNQTYSV